MGEIVDAEVVEPKTHESTFTEITLKIDPMIWARCRRMFGVSQATDEEMLLHIVKTQLWQFESERIKQEIGL